jgi:hypothetical protein
MLQPRSHEGDNVATLQKAAPLAIREVLKSMLQAAAGPKFLSKIFAHPPPAPPPSPLPSYKHTTAKGKIVILWPLI